MRAARVPTPRFMQSVCFISKNESNIKSVRPDQMERRFPYRNILVENANDQLLLHRRVLA
ncbi:hypothetical protein AS026_13315 [Rhizobium altiplani]|uniref:Uncharacterized protein n=1 Tax=Rhizobium altiplani TaxID=1864509 RepID=A0A109JF76_9HYPH|nr:hypothetical protein AS026_13315 [Rhizobium altiplani]